MSMLPLGIQSNEELPNEEKIQIFNRMERTNETMYVTGRAGSGKSFLLEYFVKNTHKKVVKVAPTGMAALNVGGQTIHSFFGLSLDAQNPETIRRQGVWGKRREVLRQIDTLIIDEVSMVRVDVMVAIDIKLQLANDNTLPFGGKQVVMFGDLYQLPPVTESQVDRYLADKYGGIFFFNAPVFNRISLPVYELETVFRQKDAEFISILNDMRVGSITENELDVLNNCSGTVPRDNHNRAVVLSPRNETVSRINQEKLDQIRRPEYMYKAAITGDFSKFGAPTEVELRLKVGAQVMMLKNDVSGNESTYGVNQGRRWVNGTIGVVSELSQDMVKVMINRVEYTIDRATWEKKVYEYDARAKKLIARTVATFTQFPLRLAWALTIHKAQGQTYKSVEVNLEGGAFGSGQTYVAVSRCVSLDRLYLTQPISKKDIIINQDVANFMDRHQNTSSPIETVVIDDKEQRRAELLRQLAELDEQ